MSIKPFRTPAPYRSRDVEADEAVETALAGGRQTRDSALDNREETVYADFGAGAEFPIGKIKILVDARYYLGLTNAVPSKPGWSMKSRSFIFTAGIIL